MEQRNISQKLAKAEWGGGVVDELAATLARRYPGISGYTRRILFRMLQFYEACRRNRKVSLLVTQLPWTHHLIILSQAKLAEAREFCFVGSEYLLQVGNQDFAIDLRMPKMTKKTRRKRRSRKPWRL